MRHTQLKGNRAYQMQLVAGLALSAAMTFAAAALVSSSAAAQDFTTSAAKQPADTGATVRVSGTVYDSVADRPLTGAQVQFVDAETRVRQYTAIADSMGRFAFDAIPPGKYIAGFFHPSVDVLGIESPLRAVTVAAGAAKVVDLGIPGPARILTSLCGPQKAADSLGAMAGVVRDAESHLPIPGATVVVSWLEVALRKGKVVSTERHVPARTDGDGGYRVCGLPGADTLFANAEFGGRHSGRLSIAILAGGILRRDFAIGDSGSAFAVVLDSTGSAEVRRQTTVLRGSSTLTGFVHGGDGKGLDGARVAVGGTGLTATTDATGHFTLGGLPAGSFSVEARAIGLEPEVGSVDLASGTATPIDISLDKHVQLLSRVTVVGKAVKNRPDIDEFLKRKRSGLGHYFTQDDPFLKYAFAVSDVISMVAGVKSLPTGTFGHIITMHDGCPATIFVDGTKLNQEFESVDNIPPNQIAGIEVYSGPLETPPRFQSFEGCGAVVIWKKR